MHTTYVPVTTATGHRTYVPMRTAQAPTVRGGMLAVRLRGGLAPHKPRVRRHA